MTCCYNSNSGMSFKVNNQTLITELVTYEERPPGFYLCVYLITDWWWRKGALVGSLSQRWHTASSLRGGRWACGEAGISITQFPAWHWSSCRLGGKVGISCRLVMRTWRSKALSLQVILTVIISPSPGKTNDILFEAKNLTHPIDWNTD